MERHTAAFRRPPVAAVLYGLLLAGMAAGQLASLDEFGAALESYDLLGPLVPAPKFGLPVVEMLAGLGLLLSRRLPPLAAEAAGLAGILVGLLWVTLAVQAFARGLVVENCGCFGVYLTQELRWWVLLEDAYLLLLALLAARSVGVTLASKDDELARDYEVNASPLPRRCPPRRTPRRGPGSPRCARSGRRAG